MKYPVVDCHADTMHYLWHEQLEIDGNNSQITVDKMRSAAPFGQFFAFCTTWFPGPSPREQYTASYCRMMKQLEKQKEFLALCRTKKDAEAAWKKNRQAVFLSLEGAEAIHCDPGLLEEVRRQGVTMVSLTWNCANALGGSCITGEGLTEQGREFVRRAQDLGILIDVSHGSDALFYDIMDITRAPVIASHSNSRALCPDRRNLTDEQFLLLAETGGFAGINLCESFLNPAGAANSEDICRHIEHFLSLGNGAHVAMGSDWDGIARLPEGVESLTYYEMLADILEQRGYSAEILENLFAGAVLRLLPGA